MRIHCAREVNGRIIVHHNEIVRVTRIRRRFSDVYTQDTIGGR